MGLEAPAARGHALAAMTLHPADDRSVRQRCISWRGSVPCTVQSNGRANRTPVPEFMVPARGRTWRGPLWGTPASPVFFQLLAKSYPHPFYGHILNPYHGHRQAGLPVPECQHQAKESALDADAHVILESHPSGDRLRIAVLAHLHHPIAPPFAGGMESHTAHLAAGLAARGHHVTLFAKEGSLAPCRVEPVLPQSYAVAGYPDSDGRDRQHQALDGAMSRAATSIRTGSYDAVLNNSLSPVPHRELAGIPTLHVLHTPVLPRLADIFGAPAWEPDPLHRHVTVSHANALQWRRWLPDIEVVHNGIALKDWGTGVEPVPGTAAWTGRITPEKGTHLAIAAARATHTRLQIAGPIQDPEYFRALIEPELDRGITYRGHLGQHELGKMISSAQVFISSPLWEEPFGLTTLEAIACGTPVAALPGGAMAEIINGHAGVVAHRRDAAALARAIIQARDLDRTQVRNSARAFSLESMIEAYENRLVAVAAVRSVPQERHS